MGLYAAKDAVLQAAQLGLGSTATHVFIHMALECWDDEDNPGRQPPRRYFARRESSAIALGFLAPANGTEAAFRAVKRATKELVDKGAIHRVRHGGNGQTAEFELQVSSTKPPRAVNAPVSLRAFEHHRTRRGQGTEDWSPQRANF